MYSVNVDDWTKDSRDVGKQGRPRQVVDMVDDWCGGALMDGHKNFPGD